MRVLFAADGILLGQLPDIGAGNKRLLARTSKDHHANRRIALDVMKRRPQLLHGRHVERIQHLWPVDRDVSNRVFLFEKYVFVVHESALSRIRARSKTYCHPERGLISTPKR